MDTARFRTRLHPMVLGAAASVMVVSLVGVGAITGLIPTASSQRGEAGAVAKNPSEQRAPSDARPPLGLPRASCPTCGVVESIRTVEVKGDGTGIGAVAGGVAGGVIGHQFGEGRGNAVATVLGAAGGALAGNEIEKNVKKRVAYRVTVRMDDGSYRTLSQSAPPAVAIGNKVQIVDGAVVPRS